MNEMKRTEIKIVLVEGEENRFGLDTFKNEFGCE